MAFVRVWLHIVFGTKNREPFLQKEIREKVIEHIFENAKTKGILINCLDGYDEHLHGLISLGLDQNIAKILNLIKGESSFWINRNNLTKMKFEWADEYLATSVM